jgi:hypothetical protein
MDEGYDAVNLDRVRRLARGEPLPEMRPEELEMRGSRSRSAPVDEADSEEADADKRDADEADEDDEKARATADAVRAGEIAAAAVEDPASSARGAPAA